MLNESLLLSRAIDPISGRVTKQHTFLGAALIVIAGSVVAAAAAYTLIVLFSVL